jgi:hypothetical protein
MGILLTPVVPVFVRQAGASDERVQRDLAELPGLLAARYASGSTSVSCLGSQTSWPEAARLSLGET